MTDPSSISNSPPTTTNNTPPPNSSDPGVWGVIKGLTFQDFKDIGRIPCGRNSLLYGIGAGMGAGAIRFAFKGHVLSASNFAMGTFCAVSLISWEICRYQLKHYHTRRTVPKVGVASSLPTPNQDTSST